MNGFAKAAVAALSGLAMFALAVAPSMPAQAQFEDSFDVPYVPTPMKTVAKMLEMAKVQPDDIVYDLGSGDGRIVIAAVRDFGVKRAIGVDIDPQRIRESEENARKAGVTDRVKFVQGDVFEFDFSEATVLTMYLLTEINRRLRPTILSSLKPGTRVVSHDFDMGEWEPDDVHSINTFRQVYLWVVPAQIEGRWEWTVGETEYRMNLEQAFQKVSGKLEVAGATYPLTSLTLAGTALGFEGHAMDAGRSQPARFAATALGSDELEGTIEVGERKIPFRAKRVAGAN